MNTHLCAMEQAKPKSCCQTGALFLYNSVQRAWLTSALPEDRRFAPFSPEKQPVIHTLFATKKITIGKRLTKLEENAHLKEVAIRAGLGGLCLFLGSKKHSSIHYDAYTADSVAEFMDGTIQHAIAIPEAVYAQNNDDAVQIIHGMIEREIARIAQAYSSDDMEVRQFWHNCGWTGYTLVSLAGLYLEPLSIIASGPGGLLLASIVRERAELDCESSLDIKAATLAQTTGHLMATLTASTKSTTAQIERQRAQGKHTNKDYPVSLNLRAQRILDLLQTQDQLEENE